MYILCTYIKRRSKDRKQIILAFAGKTAKAVYWYFVEFGGNFNFLWRNDI